MNKILAICIISLLFLGGCSTNQPSSNMSIMPGNLTEGENQIAKMLANRSQVHFFDYKVNDTIKSFRIDLYRLTEDGTWIYEEGGYGNSINNDVKQGRIMILRNYDTRALSISHQSKNGFNNLESDAKEYTEGAYGTSSLNKPQDIVLGKESPLLIEVFAPNEISTTSVDFFYDPSQLLVNLKDGGIVLATVIIFEDTLSE